MDRHDHLPVLADPVDLLLGRLLAGRREDLEVHVHRALEGGQVDDVVVVEELGDRVREIRGDDRQDAARRLDEHRADRVVRVEGPADPALVPARLLAVREVLRDVRPVDVPAEELEHDRHREDVAVAVGHDVVGGEVGPDLAEVPGHGLGHDALALAGRIE